MELYGTLERSWYAVTPAGYPIRVEEHRSDLMYIVEFYDADEVRGDSPLFACPISGELLQPHMLRQATPEVVGAFA